MESLRSACYKLRPCLRKQGKGREREGRGERGGRKSGGDGKGEG